jgi:hypothetical protein
LFSVRVAVHDFRVQVSFRVSRFGFRCMSILLSSNTVRFREPALGIGGHWTEPVTRAARAPQIIACTVLLSRLQYLNRSLQHATHAGSWGRFGAQKSRTSRASSSRSTYPFSDIFMQHVVHWTAPGDKLVCPRGQRTSAGTNGEVVPTTALVGGQRSQIRARIGHPSTRARKVNINRA